MGDDPRAPLVGHSGLTYAQWQQRRIDEFLAGKRDTLFEPHAFDREFVADTDGWMPPLEKICNAVTGEWVTLPEPIRVHIDDLDRVIAEYQEQFLKEWNSWRCPGCGKSRGELSWGHSWTSGAGAVCFEGP